MRVLPIVSASPLPILALALAPGFIQQQEASSRPRFTSDVSAVYLDVVVTGPSHLFLPKLTAEDFEIFEDGVRQEVHYFSADEVAPVTLILLLDASTSIAGSERAIRKAASNLVREMNPRDKAAVVIFSDTIMKSTHFTAFSDPLLEAIGSLYPRGATALYDAIQHSLQKLSDVPGRKALLVFTDGSDSSPMDGGSKSSSQDIIDAARRSEVTIYTVGFVAKGRGVNRNFLTTLAQESGGRAFFPVNADHLHRSFSAIEQELHTSYRLAYIPTNGLLDSSWRNIQVLLPEQPDLIVRTRQGYYAEPRFQR